MSGEKISLTLQLAPAAIEPEQFVVSVKWLVVTMEFILTAADPVLEKTTVCASDDLLTNCPPNISWEVFREAPGTTPVPIKDTVCRPRLLAIERVPDSDPATVGAYLTLTMQDAAGARELWQVLFSVKSPRIETPIPVSGAVPLLVSVAFSKKLVEPTTVLGKV